jgi:hypothetical protein
MARSTCLALLGVLLGAFSSGSPIQAQTSQLWGRDGELWGPVSRLPDFSFAGYHRGESKPPNLPRGVSVKDFGARGDGVTDDTRAFRDAIARVETGVIEVPAGRYVITNVLEITRPNLVLRSEGPDVSVLYCPRPLEEVRPNQGATTTGRPTSNYSWSGGFVWLRGDFRSRVLARVVEPAERGDTSLVVSNVSRLSVGREVEVRVSDGPDNSLARHLYSNDPGAVENLRGSTSASITARIVGVDGSRITLDRPLRCDLRPSWKPSVLSFEPTVTEVGVEGLGFEFPPTPYGGHFTEQGFNPVAFREVAHCWVRDVRVVNADSGPIISGRFNTVDGLVHESTRPTDGRGNVGHHGVYLGGEDNLYTRFDHRTRFIHDISVSHCSGVVISKGRGIDLCLDHHCRAPFENLFSDIDMGEGTRMWASGGGEALGKHCGARGTFWNLRARRPLAPPPANFGPPSINLVGVRGDRAAETSEDGRWFEHPDATAIEPADLHEAQLRRRLQSGRSPR